MQFIATRSMRQQPSLVPTPQPILSSFPHVIQTIRDNSDFNKSQKKKKKRKKNRIYIRFWKPGELWDRTLLFF